MRWGSIGFGVAMVLGCGPAVDDAAGEGSTGGGASVGSAMTSSSGAVDSGGVDTSVPEPTTTSGSETTTDAGPPSIMGWNASSVTCAEDGSTELYVEAILDLEIDGCSPPPDVDIHGFVLIVMDGWDGSPGAFEVGREAPVRMAVGEEMVTGSMTIEVWAPTHPAALILDVAGPTRALQGVLDIQACVTTNEAPCMPAGSESG